MQWNKEMFAHGDSLLFFYGYLLKNLKFRQLFYPLHIKLNSILFHLKLFKTIFQTPLRLLKLKGDKK